MSFLLYEACTVFKSKKVQPLEQVCFKTEQRVHVAGTGLLDADLIPIVGYKRLIDDGCSCVYASIREHVSVWERDVKMNVKGQETMYVSVGSIPAVGKNFSFCSSRFLSVAYTTRISQYKWNQPWYTPSLYPVLVRE